MKTKAAEYPRKHYNQKNTQGGADPSNDLVPSAELAPLERTYGKLQFIEDTIMPNGGEWDGVSFRNTPVTFGFLFLFFRGEERGCGSHC